jgi:uncharacterized protein (TIGR02722 family)
LATITNGLSTGDEEMKRVPNYLKFIFALLLVSGCAQKEFSDGAYDEDVNETNLLDDRWSESDMQEAVSSLVQSAVAHHSISTAARPPLVMVTRLQNKTSEHIDTQSVMDMVRVELMRGGKVSFVDKEAREDISEEYDYQESGIVNRESKKGKGNQTGADFIINGRLDSIVKQVDKRKTVYYKITLNMTNLSTGVIVWSDYKQIRKRFKKKTLGL